MQGIERESLFCDRLLVEPTKISVWGRKAERGRDGVTGAKGSDDDRAMERKGAITTERKGATAMERKGGDGDGAMEQEGAAEWRSERDWEWEWEGIRVRVRKGMTLRVRGN